MLGQIEDVEIALRELGYEEKALDMPSAKALAMHLSSSYNTPQEARSAPPRIEILPAGQAARNEFGHRFGSQQAMLTNEQVDALLAGRQLAVEIMEGEYVLFISVEQ